MARGPNFIDREVFKEVLAEVERVDGTQYEDIDVAYGDMSRLVVAWIAQTPLEDLKSLYNKLGWKGDAGVRQCHLAARRWFEKYHPDRPVSGERSDA